eukprot:COSAG02_NODE_659_length_18772_cov_14.955015_12_plen_92_part_00
MHGHEIRIYTCAVYMYYQLIKCNRSCHGSCNSISGVLVRNVTGVEPIAFEVLEAEGGRLILTQRYDVEMIGEIHLWRNGTIFQYRVRNTFK